MKTCRVCGEPKDILCFSKKRDSKDGRASLCKACASVERRNWAEKNPERLRSCMRAYNQENAEHIRAQRQSRYDERQAEMIAKARAYREANKEATLANKRRYYAENREKCLEVTRKWRATEYGKQRSRERCPIDAAARNAKRRAALLQAVPSWADPVLIAEFYETAQALNMWTGEWHHVDHIVPLQGKTVRGLHTQENLQILSAQENLAKKNVHWPDQP